MTGIPPEYPLPGDAFAQQGSLLRAHVEATPRPPRVARRRVVALAVVLLAGVLLVAPALGIGSRFLDLIRRTYASHEVQLPVWSPDGRRIAYVSRPAGHPRRDNNWLLSIVNADGSGRRVLTRNFGLSTPLWLPDGRIAYDSDAGPIVENADGSGKQRLPRGRSGPWSPDGRRIAFDRGSHLYVMNADGSGLRRLLKPRSAAKLTSLEWSPDGRKLVFLSTAGTSGYGVAEYCYQVHVVNADGSAERDLTRKAFSRRRVCHGGPTWSPDGRRIAFLETLRAGGRGGGSAVHVMNADGSGARRLTRFEESVGVVYIGGPAWSPDGRKILFQSALADLPDSGGEVYVMNADGSGRRNLTRNPAHDFAPDWSPDGRKIVFVSDRDGSYDLYVMNADGSGQRRLTHRGE
jgi:Tol biopolymer transport system component